MVGVLPLMGVHLLRTISALIDNTQANRYHFIQETPREITMLRAQKYDTVLRLAATNPEDTSSIIHRLVFIKRCVCEIHSPEHSCVCHLIGKWLRVVNARNSPDGTMNYQVVAGTKCFYVRKEEFWTSGQYDTLWVWERYNEGGIQKILEKFIRDAAIPPSS